MSTSKPPKRRGGRPRHRFKTRLQPEPSPAADATALPPPPPCPPTDDDSDDLPYEVIAHAQAVAALNAFTIVEEYQQSPAVLKSKVGDDWKIVSTLPTIQIPHWFDWQVRPGVVYFARRFKTDSLTAQ